VVIATIVTNAHIYIATGFGWVVERVEPATLFEGTGTIWYYDGTRLCDRNVRVAEVAQNRRQSVRAIAVGWHRRSNSRRLSSPYYTHCYCGTQQQRNFTIFKINFQHLMASL
jgi:hypothetical protein